MQYSEIVSTLAIIISLSSLFLGRLWEKQLYTAAEINRFNDLGDKYMEHLANYDTNNLKAKDMSALFLFKFQRYLFLDRLCQMYIDKSISRRIFRQRVSWSVTQCIEVARIEEKKLEFLEIDVKDPKYRLRYIYQVYEMLKK